MIVTHLIHFTGTLGVGKSLIIDTNDRTVSIDGINQMPDFDGDFPWMNPGVNDVDYTDTEGTRSVNITVTKRDRKV